MEPLQKFSIPKIKKATHREGYFHKVSVSSRDSIILLEDIKKCCLDVSYSDKIQVQEILMVHNSELNKSYLAKKSELKGRSNVPLKEDYGFFCHSSKTKADIAKHGLSVGNITFNGLGESHCGVYLSRYFDVELESSFFAYAYVKEIFVFKYIAGKSKSVKISFNGNLEPTPNFDSHVSSVPPNVSDGLYVQINRSKIYLYEYTDDCQPAKYPRQCLPYAVLKVMKLPKSMLTTDLLFKPLTFASTLTTKEVIQHCPPTKKKKKKSLTKTSLLPSAPLLNSALESSSTFTNGLESLANKMPRPYLPFHPNEMPDKQEKNAENSIAKLSHLKCLDPRLRALNSIPQNPFPSALKSATVTVSSSSEIKQHAPSMKLVSCLKSNAKSETNNLKEKKKISLSDYKKKKQSSNQSKLYPTHVAEVQEPIENKKSNDPPSSSQSKPYSANMAEIQKSSLSQLSNLKLNTAHVNNLEDSTKDTLANTSPTEALLDYLQTVKEDHLKVCADNLHLQLGTGISSPSIYLSDYEEEDDDEYSSWSYHEDTSDDSLPSSPSRSRPCSPSAASKSLFSSISAVPPSPSDKYVLPSPQTNSYPIQSSHHSISNLPSINPSPQSPYHRLIPSGYVQDSFLCHSPRPFGYLQDSSQCRAASPPLMDPMQSSSSYFPELPSYSISPSCHNDIPTQLDSYPTSASPSHNVTSTLASYPTSASPSHNVPPKPASDPTSESPPFNDPPTSASDPTSESHLHNVQLTPASDHTLESPSHNVSPTPDSYPTLTSSIHHVPTPASDPFSVSHCHNVTPTPAFDPTSLSPSHNVTATPTSYPTSASPALNAQLNQASDPISPSPSHDAPPTPSSCPTLESPSHNVPATSSSNPIVASLFQNKLLKSSDPIASVPSHTFPHAPPDSTLTSRFHPTPTDSISILPSYKTSSPSHSKPIVASPFLNKPLPPCDPIRTFPSYKMASLPTSDPTVVSPFQNKRYQSCDPITSLPSQKFTPLTSSYPTVASAVQNESLPSSHPITALSSQNIPTVSELYDILKTVSKNKALPSSDSIPTSTPPNAAPLVDFPSQNITSSCPSDSVSVPHQVLPQSLTAQASTYFNHRIPESSISHPSQQSSVFYQQPTVPSSFHHFPLRVSYPTELSSAFYPSLSSSFHYPSLLSPLSNNQSVNDSGFSQIRLPSLYPIPPLNPTVTSHAPSTPQPRRTPPLFYIVRKTVSSQVSKAAPLSNVQTFPMSTSNVYGCTQSPDLIPPKVLIPAASLTPHPISSVPEHPGMWLPPQPVSSLPEHPGTWLSPQHVASLSPKPMPSLPPQHAPSLTSQSAPSLTPQPAPSLTPQPAPSLTLQPAPSLPPQPAPSLPPQPAPSLPPQPAEFLPPQPAEFLPPQPAEFLPPLPPNQDSSVIDSEKHAQIEEYLTSTGLVSKPTCPQVQDTASKSLDDPICISSGDEAVSDLPQRNIKFIQIQAHNLKKRMKEAWLKNGNKNIEEDLRPKIEKLVQQVLQYSNSSLNSFLIKSKIQEKFKALCFYESKLKQSKLKDAPPTKCDNYYKYRCPSPPLTDYIDDNRLRGNQAMTPDCIVISGSNSVVSCCDSDVNSGPIAISSSATPCSDLDINPGYVAISSSSLSLSDLDLTPACAARSRSSISSIASFTSVERTNFIKDLYHKKTNEKQPVRNDFDSVSVHRSSSDLANAPLEALRLAKETILKEIDLLESTDLSQEENFGNDREHPMKGETNTSCPPEHSIISKTNKNACFQECPTKGEINNTSCISASSFVTTNKSCHKRKWRKSNSRTIQKNNGSLLVKCVNDSLDSKTEDSEGAEHLEPKKLTSSRERADVTKYRPPAASNLCSGHQSKLQSDLLITIVEPEIANTDSIPSRKVDRKRKLSQTKNQISREKTAKPMSFINKEHKALKTKVTKSSINVDAINQHKNIILLDKLPKESSKQTPRILAEDCVQNKHKKKDLLKESHISSLERTTKNSSLENGEMIICLEQTKKGSTLENSEATSPLDIAKTNDMRSSDEITKKSVSLDRSKKSRSVDKIEKSVPVESIKDIVSVEKHTMKSSFERSKKTSSSKITSPIDIDINSPSNTNRITSPLKLDINRPSKTNRITSPLKLDINRPRITSPLKLGDKRKYNRDNSHSFYSRSLTYRSTSGLPRPRSRSPRSKSRSPRSKSRSPSRRSPRRRSRRSHRSRSPRNKSPNSKRKVLNGDRIIDSSGKKSSSFTNVHPSTLHSHTAAHKKSIVDELLHIYNQPPSQSGSDSSLQEPSKIQSNLDFYILRKETPVRRQDLTIQMFMFLQTGFLFQEGSSCALPFPVSTILNGQDLDIQQQKKMGEEIMTFCSTLFDLPSNAFIRSKFIYDLPPCVADMSHVEHFSIQQFHFECKLIGQCHSLLLFQGKEGVPQSDTLEKVLWRLEEKRSRVIKLASDIEGIAQKLKDLNTLTDTELTPQVLHLESELTLADAEHTASQAQAADTLKRLCLDNLPDLTKVPLLGFTFDPPSLNLLDSHIQNMKHSFEVVTRDFVQTFQSMNFGCSHYPVPEQLLLETEVEQLYAKKSSSLLLSASIPKQDFRTLLQLRFEIENVQKTNPNSQDSKKEEIVRLTNERARLLHRYVGQQSATRKDKLEVLYNSFLITQNYIKKIIGANGLKQMPLFSSVATATERHFKLLEEALKECKKPT